VLVGFPIAAPGSSQLLVLWPSNLLFGSGDQLRLTDVRVVVDSADEFGALLAFFVGDGRSIGTVLWTVRARE